LYRQKPGRGCELDLHGVQLNVTTIIADQNHEQHVGIEHIAIETDDYAGALANFNKSYRAISGSPRKRQPLTAAFRGSEHLGAYGGHGTKNIGAVCEPKAFDGMVTVEPGVLGSGQGSVTVDLVEPGYEPRPDSSAPQSHVFPRNSRSSIVITVHPDNRHVGFLHWPRDFVKVA
jgi:hypothetical protein